MRTSDRVHDRALRFPSAASFALLALASCGSESTSPAPGAVAAITRGNDPASARCPALPGPPADLPVEIAAEYRSAYSVYELGPLPGMPVEAPLGGAVLLAGTTDTLLVGAYSEMPGGGLYTVKLKRDACNHIVGYASAPTRVAEARFVDATLLYGPGNVLIFPQWNTEFFNRMGQLPPGATQTIETDTAALGIGGGGPGSAGFVPPNVTGAAGRLRVLTQNEATQDGYWYHVDYAAGGAQGTFRFLNPQRRLTLPNWPGGFAYVPLGSPKFDRQSLIVTEWSTDTVATYAVDEAGDPVPSTRKAFFTQFPKPWGAYFEPVAGDYLFLTWNDPVKGPPTADRILVVAGFKPPPAPPAAIPK